MGLRMFVLLSKIGLLTLKTLCFLGLGKKHYQQHRDFCLFCNFLKTHVFLYVFVNMITCCFLEITEIPKKRNPPQIDRKSVV